jgi:hypothetical protein
MPPQNKWFSSFTDGQQGDQGSMLWSQFSAIFGNFRQKIGAFLKNQCYDQIFS